MDVGVAAIAVVEQTLTVTVFAAVITPVHQKFPTAIPLFGSAAGVTTTAKVEGNAIPEIVTAFVRQAPRAIAVPPIEAEVAFRGVIAVTEVVVAIHEGAEHPVDVGPMFASHCVMRVLPEHE